MATIFYGVMGEGRGHAARARTMVEALRNEHRIVLFSSFDALGFLQEAYADDADVEVHAIEGLKFHYTAGKLNNRMTVAEGLRFWKNCGKQVARLAPLFESQRPDLVISDFEPLLPRAARKHGVPVVSFDHQHFMVAYDLSRLPLRLRSWAKAMSLTIPLFRIKQQFSIVSAFYQPPLRRKWQASATQVGPLIRPAVRDTTPTRGDHLLSYLRKSTPPAVVDALASCGQPVRIYGLGAREPHGDATFCEVSEMDFRDDLVSCDAVVAAAGNQLLGESLHLGKPVLALPEHNHHEQCINAWFLKDLGGGDWEYLERAGPEKLLAFLASREEYRENLTGRADEFDGTLAAKLAIENVIAAVAQ